MTSNLNITNSYLSFRIGDEQFAANVVQVSEILEIPRITKVPHSPNFMRGVINLRGTVLPVIDTRIKFGLPSIDDSIESCIIVVNITLEDQAILVGALVDQVFEVLEIEDHQIIDAPNIGIKYKVEFIKGMYKVNDEFLMLLNLDSVFSTDETLLIKDITQNQTEIKL